MENKVIEKKPMENKIPTKKVFYIHIYKTMGTTIYNFYSPEFKKKYYGWRTLDEYEILNNVKLNPAVKHTFMNKKLSIDHLTVDEMMNLGILTPKEIKSYVFICIIRNPIDRFLSICNYEDGRAIPNTKRGIDFYINKLDKIKTQSDMINLKTKIELIKVKFDDKKKIEETFNQYGMKINLNAVHLNSSEKRYSRKDINKEQMMKIRHYFKKDIELYKSLV